MEKHTKREWYKIYANRPKDLYMLGLLNAENDDDETLWDYGELANNFVADDAGFLDLEDKGENAAAIDELRLLDEFGF